jgi:DNA transformation protein
VDHDYIADLFSAFGAVDARRMFGGVGIYAEGTMFALAYDGAVYLKADEATIGAFQQEGATPFAYAAKSGRRAVMSYWRLPDRLYDDPDELARWALEALAAARRSAAPGRKTKARVTTKPRR